MGTWASSPTGRGSVPWVRRRLVRRGGEVRRTGQGKEVGGQQLAVKEAILIMTRARSGSLSVVNPRGKMVGVFTDGDFRRHIAEDKDLLAQQLSKVMTRNPICIRDDSLAVEALKVFTARNIDDSIVLSARHEPVGSLRCQ